MAAVRGAQYGELPGGYCVIENTLRLLFTKERLVPF